MVESGSAQHPAEPGPAQPGGERTIAAGAERAAAAPDAAAAPGADPADPAAAELPWGVGSIRPSSSAVESGALAAAGFGCLVGFIAGYLATAGSAVPIAGYGSVGSTSAIVAALVAATAFVMGVLSPRAPKRERRRRGTGRAARTIDVVALTVTQAATVFLLVTGASAVVGQTFPGAPVFAVPAAFVGAAIAAVAAYFAFLSAADLDAAHVATLLAVFLVGGAVTSMLSATEPDWWRRNVSALGAAPDVPGAAVDLTLVLGGLVLMTLVRYVGGELDAWADGRGTAAARGGRIVPLALGLVGLCLVVAGLVPVGVGEAVHGTAATAMIVVVVALLVAMRGLLPGLPTAFRMVGYVFAAVVALAAALFWPFAYFPLTVTESVVAALVFAWLVILVRNLAALARDRERAEAAPEDGAS